MSTKQNHKRWRKDFRNAVFERDKYACRKCGKTETLDAHHITDRNEMSNGGYVVSNGISLCPNCHKMAEYYHISGGDSIEGYSPIDLYNLIGSSWEIACRDSRNLV